MIKLHKYSQSKFTGFSKDKQLKAILELLSVLEQNIADSEYRKELIPVIMDCLNWSTTDIQKEMPHLYKLEKAAYPQDILNIIVPILSYYNRGFVETEPELFRFDGLHGKPEAKPPYPIYVIMDNLRSAYNTGSIFRTAECVQAEWLFVCGITPLPIYPKVFKTAMGTSERVKWTFMAEAQEAVQFLKEKGIPIIAMETTSKAMNMFDYKPSQPVAVILGNEALGIDERVLAMADEVLYIPVLGWKNSLNVSNAFAIAAYWLSGIVSK